MTALANLSLLVVDDDLDSLILLTCILEGEGARVTPVASATEALAVMEQQQPDVLLSDIAMPDMDGYLLMDQIRSRGHDRGGSVPAIAVTAMADEDSYQQAMLAGYQMYFCKPIDQDQLVTAIAGLTSCKLR
jgi:CheY-like chemotaxis protein